MGYSYYYYYYFFFFFEGNKKIWIEFQDVYIYIYIERNNKSKGCQNLRNK